MDVFRELMEKLGVGTSITLCEGETYCLQVPVKKELGRHDYFYNEDPIIALEEALEARNEDQD